MDPAQERRVSTRSILSLEAMVAFDGSMQTYAARMINLSTGGARFTVAQPVEVSQKLRLLLKTPQGAWCPIQGRVVAAAGGEVSMQFAGLGMAAATVLGQLLSTQTPALGMPKYVHPK